MAIMKTVEKKAKMVSFSLEAPEAKSVMLTGDFNDWDKASLPLKRTGSKNRTWKRDISLKPGRYEYKFIVDGSWITDPKNSNKTPNRFGSENSIIEV